MYSINFNFLKLTFQYKLIQSSVDFSLSSFNLTLSFWAFLYFFFLFSFFPPLLIIVVILSFYYIWLSLGAEINTHVQSTTSIYALHYTYLLNFFTCHLAILNFLQFQELSCHVILPRYLKCWFLRQNKPLYI